MLGTIQTSSWEKTREHYCLAAADNDYKRSKAISNAPSLVTVFTYATLAILIETLKHSWNLKHSIRQI
ncbi:hypothetical protein G6F70_003740 [Rhizopus microsporus]|nr:hypothetical protein G6F71_003724 [Rhizopus microsporus]KAG1200786.1 hypothetical protein G6F70_003740 [Rhizopus microsporus]KAG1212566.1 hypothetical protein G6F69_003590 [Rhizopus microsporus]KAG1234585.1 hypothetical protein G6F67_003411 [Rhizopus microsporus]KAG1266894.1 hypothetical protein G6F68_002371 [Rhizopus microsporus]